MQTTTLRKVSTGVRIHIEKGSTFFHASTPHVCEFFRLHRCAMLRITPYKVRQNKISSSYTHFNFRLRRQNGGLTLYMVMQMNNSVRRFIWFWRKKWPLFSKSSGSHVTAVYLVFITSGWPTRGKTSFGGTGRSRTRFPFVSGTVFVVLFRRATRPVGAGPK